METNRNSDLQDQHKEKCQKRKRQDESDHDKDSAALLSREARQALLTRVVEQVKILHKTFSWSEFDRASAKRATQVLAKLAKNEEEETVNLIVGSGAVPALVKHLQAPPLLSGDDRNSRPLEHEVEKGSAYALGLLSVEPEHQQLIVDCGALSHLVDLLKRHKEGSASHAVNSLIRRAADAIANLAYDNSSIKIRVRMEGGIPPLVELLDFNDSEVQRAAAGALRTLAFKNDENKNMIVKHNALQTLIKMLGSDDAAIFYEAVGTIANLVHSSPNIKKEVLSSGALQPVIGLLSSCCPKSQREAALLLGQFAAADSDCKVDIVQGGAVQPLIEMLQSQYVQLREISTFALGRLAQGGTIANLVHSSPNIKKEVLSSGALQPVIGLLSSHCPESQSEAALLLGQFAAADADCKVDIVQRGAVPPLIEMLQSPYVQLREMSAFALGRLAQDTHNQAGTAFNGGLVPLLKLLDSKVGSLEHNAAFALYGLAGNEDNVSDFIRLGGVKKLRDGEFILQATKDCVAKTLKRLEEKIHRS